MWSGISGINFDRMGQNFSGQLPHKTRDESIQSRGHFLFSYVLILLLS